MVAKSKSVKALEYVRQRFPRWISPKEIGELALDSCERFAETFGRNFCQGMVARNVFEVTMRDGKDYYRIKQV